MYEGDQRDPKMNCHHQRTTNQPVPDAGGVAALSSPICSAPGPARRGAWPWGLTALVVTVLFAAGCTTSKSSAVSTRPGDGLREYQRLVRDLRQDVRRTSQILEALGPVSQKNSSAAYARFDASLHRLEVDSITARARVDAMEKRGEAYFKEWAEEISGPANEAAHRVAQERFAQLHGHFEAILKDTELVRQAFQPFLEGLRESRTKLGQKPVFAAIEMAKPDFARLASAGRRAEESLDQLSKTLQAAAADVTSGPLPPTESIAKP
jgi:hypothetical protein